MGLFRNFNENDALSWSLDKLWFLFKQQPAEAVQVTTAKTTEAAKYEGKNKEEAAERNKEKHNKLLMFMDWLKPKHFYPRLFISCGRKEDDGRNISCSYNKQKRSYDVTFQSHLLCKHVNAETVKLVRDVKKNAINVSNNTTEQTNKK